MLVCAYVACLGSTEIVFTARYDLGLHIK